MTPERQKALDRILKLLALAQGTTFDAEAASARKMADELIAQHNVELAKEGKPQRDQFTAKDYNPWGKQWLWEWIIANAVANLCGCEPYYRGPTIKADAKPNFHAFIFAGQTPNVEAALYILPLVHRQRTNAWQRYKLGGGQDSFGKFCFSFARAVESKAQTITTPAIEAETAKAKLWYESIHDVSHEGEAIRGKGSSDAGHKAGQAASFHRGEINPTKYIGYTKKIGG